MSIIELMIVVTIIAIIVAVGIPNLLRSRATANEGVTIGSLRTLSTFEAVFKQQGEVDQNSNGSGEYGLLGELSSELALRPSTNRLVQPIYVSQQFRTGGNAGDGAAAKSGYNYRIYLSNAASGDETRTGHDKDLGGTSTLGGPAPDALAISRQEVSFALYAWPMEFQRSGYRCFFINEAGQVYFTKMDVNTYDGVLAPPPDKSAYVQGSTVFKGKIASSTTVGNDTNHWFPAGG